jgi:hypothetical protein
MHDALPYCLGANGILLLGEDTTRKRNDSSVLSVFSFELRVTKGGIGTVL